MANSEYPPVSFHFQVTFHDVGEDGVDSKFQSVSGLSAEMGTDTYREGGENRFEYILPTRSRYSTLVFKRGLIKNSNLIKWCTDTFENMIIKPVKVTVILLNENSDPLMTWSVEHAWPKKWAVSDLNAEQGEIAIETLELNYQFFTLET